MIRRRLLRIRLTLVSEFFIVFSSLLCCPCHLPSSWMTGVYFWGVQEDAEQDLSAPDFPHDRGHTLPRESSSMCHGFPVDVDRAANADTSPVLLPDSPMSGSRRFQAKAA